MKKIDINASENWSSIKTGIHEWFWVVPKSKPISFQQKQKHLRRNGTVSNIHVRSKDNLELQMALNSAKILTDKISTQQHYEIFQGMSFVRNLKRLPRLRLDIIWSQNANSALHHKLKSDRDLYFWEAVRSRKNCIDFFLQLLLQFLCQCRYNCVQNQAE